MQSVLVIGFLNQYMPHVQVIGLRGQLGGKPPLTDEHQTKAVVIAVVRSNCIFQVEAPVFELIKSVSNRYCVWMGLSEGGLRTRPCLMVAWCSFIVDEVGQKAEQKK